MAVIDCDKCMMEEMCMDVLDLNGTIGTCPHFTTLESGDPTLQEYIQTGGVKSCPHCGGHDIQAYGYAFKTKGSVLFICTKCGAIGRHFGLKLIHKHADPKIVRIWPDIWDDDLYSDPYPFEGPERKPPVPEDYGFHENNGE